MISEDPHKRLTQTSLCLSLSVFLRNIVFLLTGSLLHWVRDMAMGGVAVVEGMTISPWEEGEWSLLLLYLVTQGDSFLKDLKAR